MPLDVVPPPPMKTVAQVGKAPESVSAILRQYNRANPHVPSMSACAVTRMGVTHTMIRTRHKSGQLIDVTIGDDSEAMVLAACAILARAAESDGAITHLRDPGPQGNNAPAPVEDAPRDVVTVL